jgi:glycosyltransferase involved in cell wall biosynthesis
MRILQLIPDIGVGGAERMMAQLAREQMQLGNEVLVVSLFNAHGNSVEASLHDAGIETVWLGKKLGFDHTMFRALLGVLDKYRPDIVHTHRYALTYALPALLARSSSRAVHTVHNLAERELGWTGRLAHRIAFGIGVAPVAIGESVAESIKQVYGREPRAIIPHGIPLQDYRGALDERDAWRQHQDIPEECVVFGCVARLAPQKNLALLIEAFGNLPHGPRSRRLLIAGEGPERGPLEVLVAALNLKGRVQFLGLRSDIPAFLSAIDVFALSSGWEGNPLSIMEAMASGKAVVSTLVGGVPEFVADGETGILVPPGDVAALTRAMSALAEDEATRKRMGEAGARRAFERFDIAVMAARYQTLYSELLG